MATITWELFKNTYLKPLINDVSDQSYDDKLLYQTTYLTIVDITSKGITGALPQPSSSILPGLNQINYITPGSSIKPGNLFYISINEESVNYVSVLNDTIESVVTELVNLVNNSTQPSFLGVTATNQTFRLKIESSESFVLNTATAQGNTATNNPLLENVIAQKASEDVEELTPITNLTAVYKEGFSTIAYGVRYFLISDPILRLKTTSGLDITKDKDLILDAKQDYFQSLLAYINANNVDNDLTTYWKTKLVSSLGDSNSLTYEQRLALLNKEYDRKIDQDDNSILDTSTQQRLSQDNNTRNQKSILQLKRQWELENDFKKLNNQQATNGYWTPAGQITVSFLSDYKVELEDTIVRDLNNIPNSYFGLGYQINSGIQLTGTPVDVSKYTKLQLTITADYPITFSFYASDNGVTYSQIGSSTTNSQLRKEYYLPPSKFIRVDILGTINNTNFYIEGTLVA